MFHKAISSQHSNTETAQAGASEEGQQTKVSWAFILSQSKQHVSLPLDSSAPTASPSVHPPGWQHIFSFPLLNKVLVVHGSHPELDLQLAKQATCTRFLNIPIMVAGNHRKVLSTSPDSSQQLAQVTRLQQFFHQGKTHSNGSKQ